MLLEILGRRGSGFNKYTKYSPAELAEFKRLELAAPPKRINYDNSRRLESGVRSKDDTLDDLAGVLLADFELNKLKITPQKASKYHRAIRVIILNLLLARFEDPTRFVAYSRASGYYSGVSYKPFIKLIDMLTRRGFIEHKPGYRKQGEYVDIDSRQSRMRVTKNFVDLYSIFPVKPCSIYYEKPEILVTKQVTLKKKKEYIPEKSLRTRLITSRLRKINEQITKSEIEILIPKPVMHSSDPRRFLFDKRDIKLYRKFADKDCVTHGRFYGHHLQSVPRGLREYVTIDGEPIAYLDLGSCHTNMAYALSGLPPCGDAYEIGETDIPREYVKVAQAVMLHGTKGKPARSIASTITKANKEKRPGTDKIHTKPGFAKRVYEGLLAKHAGIAEFYGSKMAMQLMYYESCLAEDILLRLARENITCIPMHDGFIVAHSKKERLRQVMIESYQCMFGQTPVIKEQKIR